MREPINRDHAKAALSVYVCAAAREDLDPVDAMLGAMVAALEQYRALEERDAQDRAAADRRRFWRANVERATGVRLSLRQVMAIRRSLGLGRGR